MEVFYRVLKWVQRSLNIHQDMWIKAHAHGRTLYYQNKYIFSTSHFKIGNEKDINFSITMRCPSNDAIHFTESHPPALHLRRQQMAGTLISSHILHLHSFVSCNKSGLETSILMMLKLCASVHTNVPMETTTGFKGVMGPFSKH